MTKENKAINKPILLQGAMDMEVDIFISKLENLKEETFNGYTFWSGSIEGREVVISKTEVGLVNAAASTILGIQNYRPSVIINQGTSGAHDPSFHTFDMIVGEYSFNMGAWKSDFAPVGAGINTANWCPIKLRVNGEKVEHDKFYGDEELIKTAMATQYKHGKLEKGVIGSFDMWNRELDRIVELHEKYNTSSEEMETVAASQMAEVFNIPFVGIRIISNAELHREDFDPQSAVFCQEFVMDVVKNIK